MKILHVKPGKDLVIRDPATGRVIPAHGISVPATPFWRQRLSHGDVAATTEAEIAAAEAPATTESALAETDPPETGKPARKVKE
jgi:hypothetical protein